MKNLFPWWQLLFTETIQNIGSFGVLSLASSYISILASAIIQVLTCQRQSCIFRIVTVSGSSDLKQHQRQQKTTWPNQYHPSFGGGKDCTWLLIAMCCWGHASSLISSMMKYPRERCRQKQDKNEIELNLVNPVLIFIWMSSLLPMHLFNVKLKYSSVYV